jgi:hypothetical protein
VAPKLKTTYSAWRATLGGRTVRELLAELPHLPRDLEIPAFEAGCEANCEREVDDLQDLGGTERGAEAKGRELVGVDLWHATHGAVVAARAPWPASRRQAAVARVGSHAYPQPQVCPRQGPSPERGARCIGQPCPVLRRSAERPGGPADDLTQLVNHEWVRRSALRGGVPDSRR